MIAAGFDIGTRFIKVCILDGVRLAGFAVSEVDMNIGKLMKTTFKAALANAGLKKGRVAQVVATGFGSALVGRADDSYPVAPCIARAAYAVDRSVRTIVDLGALFINVVTTDGRGFVADAFTNENCAAGSGKFLEMVSGAVDIPFAAISDCALKSNSPYRIHSSCAVFAESEIISQVNSGADRCDVLAGVLHSIASRTATLLERTDMRREIAICGGLSAVPAIRVMLQRLIKRDVMILPLHPQLLAAYGAALLAEGEKSWTVRRRSSRSAREEGADMGVEKSETPLSVARGLSPSLLKGAAYNILLKEQDR